MWKFPLLQMQVYSDMILKCAEKGKNSKMNLHCIKILIFLLLTGSVSGISAQSFYLELKHKDENARKAYFAQKIHRFWGKNVYRSAPDRYHGLLVLKNKKITFAFDIRGKYKDGKASCVNIGMVRPCGLNWYAGGFFQAFCGKENLINGDFTVLKIYQGSDLSYALLQFKGKNHTSTLRMTLAEADDKLLLEFTSGIKNRPCEIRLIAYPGEYGSAEKRQRRIVTCKGEYSQHKELGKEEFWGLFFDSYYDRAKKRGRGCCAFVYNPQETLSAQVEISYPCTAIFRYKGDQKAHLVLWDFLYWPSRDAITYMKQLKVSFDPKQK